MKKRVVITGLGAVTPIGNNVKDFWKGIREEQTGFGPITYFDTEKYRCKLAAQVKDFDPTQHMDKKMARRMELFCQYAVAAAGEAIADAGLQMEEEDAFRVGCSVGSGVGSHQTLEREYDRLKEKGPGRISPMMVPLMISNMAAGNISIAFGLKGKSLDVVTACASGTHSVGEAFRSIQYGEADVMLAGGTESAISPIGIAGFSALTALSLSEDPSRCSIPFDKDRDGFVMGEGAGILVLEELEHAQKRGAHIYAEVVGYGATSDAYHITSPMDDGSGAAKAMQYALEDGQVEKEALTYINAHGTSTPYNDLFETRAIKLAFGEHAKNLKINSTKSMIGHLLGAAGAVELIVCAKSIEEGFIHRTVGFSEPGEELDLNYCPVSYEEEVPYALSNSLGFGGHNASVLLKKFE